MRCKARRDETRRDETRRDETRRDETSAVWRATQARNNAAAHPYAPREGHVHWRKSPKWRQSALEEHGDSAESAAYAPRLAASISNSTAQVNIQSAIANTAIQQYIQEHLRAMEIRITRSQSTCRQEQPWRHDASRITALQIAQGLSAQEPSANHIPIKSGDL